MATMINKGILGRKVGMTRIFQEDGEAVACTLVEAGPCKVIQRKTGANDGYDAIQIGFLPRKEKRTTQPMQGHYKKHAQSEPMRFLREIRLTGEHVENAPEVGAELRCEIFEPGEAIDVIGTMKGRGYSGVVKRHNFATLKESHGSHFFVRHAGSIGSRKPQHTLQAARACPGQYGNTRVTVQNLEVLRVDAREATCSTSRARVPGPNNGTRLRSAPPRKKQRPAGSRIDAASGQAPRPLPPPRRLPLHRRQQAVLHVADPLAEANRRVPAGSPGSRNRRFLLGAGFRAACARGPSGTSRPDRTEAPLELGRTLNALRIFS